MLEQKIEQLTQAVITLTQSVTALSELIDITRVSQIMKAAEQVKAEPKPAPVVAPGTWVEVDPGIKVEVLSAAPVMPAAPTFEPVAAPAANAAPFTDGKGLIDYVMTVYKELGAEKGAQIQGVLTEMGLQNVNELRPTEYDAFFAKVEALK